MIRRLFIPFGLAFSIACSGEKDGTTDFDNLSLSFELDTVMVDAGEDLIHVRSALHHAGFSSDGKTLYNYNNRENLLEVIDMDHLRLSHKIPFELEGPHGTGQVIGFQNLMGGNYQVANFTSMGIFSEQGQKEHSYDFSKLPEDIFEENEVVAPGGIISEDGKSFYAFFSKGWANSIGFVKMDLESGEMIRTPVEQLEALDRFTIRSHDKYQVEISFVARYLAYHKGNLLISNSVENQILVYNPDEEKLVQHDFHSELTSNKTKDLTKREVDSQEEIPAIRKALEKDVFFGKWLFDPSRERFYRLTYLFDRERDSKAQYKVVLTVLDDRLNQIYEGVTPLKSKQLSTFVREGKLYVFENIDDELGFVVMTLKEA